MRRGALDRIGLLALVMLSLAVACRRGPARPTLEVEGYETHVWSGTTTTTLPPSAVPAPRTESAPAPRTAASPPATPAPDAPPAESPRRSGWERAKPW